MRWARNANCSQHGAEEDGGRSRALGAQGLRTSLEGFLFPWMKTGHSPSSFSCDHCFHSFQAWADIPRASHVSWCAELCRMCSRRGGLSAPRVLLTSRTMQPCWLWKPTLRTCAWEANFIPASWMAQPSTEDQQTLQGGLICFHNKRKWTVERDWITGCNAGWKGTPVLDRLF